MSTQQPLFPDATQQPEPRPQPAPDSVPAPVWLQRMGLITLVLFCLYIGVILTIMPWSPRYWDTNNWMLAHPAVYAVLQHGWARGFVSGLGLLDIWIGISEAVHYRDYRP